MSPKPIVLRLGKFLFAKEAWERLGSKAEIITVPDSTTRETFLAGLKDPNSPLSKVQFITRTFASVKQTGRFDKELCEALPSTCKGIQHMGAGYDQIDVKWFLERGIQVGHVPHAVNEATADDHVFLLLGALRNFSIGNRLLLEGKWADAKGNATAPAAGTPIGHDPQGKIVGVLGLGGIGRTIVDRLKPFGFAKFIYHNRHKLSSDLENGCEYVTFDELLAQSDVISVNIPLNAGTRHILNKEAFGKMKDGVVIVNTARGAVIDEAALIDALKSGKVRSAGLDVFEHEPTVPKELLEMPQVLGLPHMGTHTVETILRMENIVVENVENYFETGKIKNIVPEMQGKF
ncbi:probable Glyoxylate reductase 1 [Saccharomycodes ludwigii]|uniref:Probable Glyoxylate reductase 1 n=1 Tax=Saccharomycodes ludwigii TaxID=36035 RepID=A0A376BB92_9ASCO|nr:hypothetical protein SCDLUD_003885 [Saccharomycodes ludwigii]KAH3899605.1 hypothetical protein SCDLUD_003885 [Saccharomycodes ludwigii]SSD61953.1 probable Glyoxylate reductase 1 [Saccharomycodes ludwigii]